MPQPQTLQTLRVPLGGPGQPLRYCEVPITDVEGGLALQRALHGPGWHVVHVGSGRLVSRAPCRKAAARALQRALLALPGIDWHRSHTRLRRLAAAQWAQVVALLLDA